VAANQDSWDTSCQDVEGESEPVAVWDLEHSLEMAAAWSRLADDPRGKAEEAAPAVMPHCMETVVYPKHPVHLGFRMSR
jgi:hypothetical protein